MEKARCTRPRRDCLHENAPFQVYKRQRFPGGNSTWGQLPVLHPIRWENGADVISPQLFDPLPKNWHTIAMGKHVLSVNTCGLKEGRSSLMIEDVLTHDCQ